MRAAAMRHIKSGGGFHSQRATKLGFEKQACHYFSLHDRRFQEHHSFLFVFFNIMQRRTTSLHTKLKTSNANFQGLASELASVSDTAIQAVIDRVSRGDHATANNDDERTVLKLMREVSLISSKVPGSAAHGQQCAMRFEL